MEGNLRFHINWASLTVGSKFTVVALFYFVFQGKFSKYKFPGGGGGGLHLEGPFNGAFCALPLWGGLYLEAYGTPIVGIFNNLIYIQFSIYI